MHVYIYFYISYSFCISTYHTWFNRSSYFLRFHTASNSILFYTRYIFTLPRVFYIYISFHLLNVHTFVLYSYFDIFPRIVINIFPRISYIRIVFYSFPIFIIIFFYSLFLFSSFFFFINLHPFFHLYIQYLLHIQRSSSSFCVKYYSNLLEYPRIGNITIIVE